MRVAGGGEFIDMSAAGDGNRRAADGTREADQDSAASSADQDSLLIWLSKIWLIPRMNRTWLLCQLG